MINQKLKKTDQVKNCWNKDFACVPYNEVDCAMVERLLERNAVVFITK